MLWPAFQREFTAPFIDDLPKQNGEQMGIYIYIWEIYGNINWI